jgi:hypothetical protein
MGTEVRVAVIEPARKARAQVSFLRDGKRPTASIPVAPAFSVYIRISRSIETSSARSKAELVTD